MRNKKAIQTELAKVTKDHGGVLKPIHVIEEARNSRSALHSHFEWSDTIAAHQYRVWQAEKLIRLTVDVLPYSDGQPRRVYVSLVEDRNTPQGGYRPLLEVMRDPERRAALLRQAYAEFRRVRNTYQDLKELGPVIAAIDTFGKEIKAEEAAGA